MNTISVDIKTEDLITFHSLSSFSLRSLTKEGYEELFKEFPFTLYKKRMSGESFLTIQIPLIDFCLFLSSGLVK